MWLSRWTILRSAQSLGLRKHEVLLTFDDGPNVRQRTTERLLDVLQGTGVKACFCVIGAQVRRAPETLLRIRREGHLIANLTERHHVPPWQNTEKLVAEIRECDRAIAQALDVADYRCRVFRPPYGLLTPAVARAVAQLGLRLAPVSYYAFDTRLSRRNCHSAVERLVENARRQAGGVFVLHDDVYRESGSDRRSTAADRAWVPEATRSLIERLRGLGLRIADPHATFGG